jgi:hypothetical protein
VFGTAPGAQGASSEIAVGAPGRAGAQHVPVAASWFIVLVSLSPPPLGCNVRRGCSHSPGLAMVALAHTHHHRLSRGGNLTDRVRTETCPETCPKLSTSDAIWDHPTPPNTAECRGARGVKARRRATSSATTSHTYASANHYTATLTVTDDAGCSTTQTFTGQTMSCNGGPAASISHQLTVGAAPNLFTSASSNTEIGNPVSDFATLLGGSSPTGTIVFRLYGRNDTTCSNGSAFAKKVTVSSNGNYGSGNFTPTKRGTYRWRAFYSGDSNNASASTACNDPGESVSVL